MAAGNSASDNVNAAVDSLKAASDNVNAVTDSLNAASDNVNAAADSRNADSDNVNVAADSQNAKASGKKETSSTDFAARIRNEFKMKENDIKSYSALTLAYIGDDVFDIVIRTIVVERGNCPVNKLHRRVSELVKAASQCKMIELIEKDLTEEEMAVFKRGRNAKSYTMAKNATMNDYRMATGMEALMGYLYLTGQTERYVYLIKLALERFEAK